MDLDQHPCARQPGLKVVCEAGGSRAIKASGPAGEPEQTKIHCRRCNAVRGTLADLHDLARRSADVLEF